MNITEKLQQIVDEFTELEKQLMNPDTISNQNKFKTLSKQRAAAEETATLAKEFLNKFDQLEQAREVADNPDTDTELRELALLEIDELESELKSKQKDIELLLLPKDPNDSKDVILEIRAGAGGDEAGLFAGDLLRMYLRFAEENGYKPEMISNNTTGIGGTKEAIVRISGANAYKALKFESGVHRVQRVPETEKSGRIHTSTATVVVLPEVEEQDFEIKREDLKIDTYRAGGAGGQHVNKTESAVRITHLPTGAVAASQSERSQGQNKAQAMNILRSKIIAKLEADREAKESNKRKLQVGSGDRSEKIRTYNFPQNRITDHRIKHTENNIEDFLNAGKTFRQMARALHQADQQERLANATAIN